MEKIRLQKYLAECGVASRRKAEDLIRQGYVTVNGNAISDMGIKVDGNDIVQVNGRIVNFEERKVYVMLNKPVGYVTSVSDQFSRPVVTELTCDIKERIYPVGRLDYDTSGLLILSNDGDFTYRLTHPKHEVNKKYLAEIKGLPDKDRISTFKKGLKIEDYITSPAGFDIVESGKDTSLVMITIHEGKNRQVRKMCAAIGHPVIALKRISIGEVELGDLPEGKWRYLNENELQNLGQ